MRACSTTLRIIIDRLNPNRYGESDSGMRMRIFRAVGLAIAIVVLQYLTPKIYAGFEDTLVQFFHLAQVVMAHAGTIVTSTSSF